MKTDDAERDRNAVLYVADIAKILRVSRSTARAWLAALEKEHGPTVVRRLGRRLSIRARTLERFLPGDDPHRRQAHADEMRAARRERQVAEILRTLALHDERIERVESLVERFAQRSA